jgi:hypothetical protein
MAKAKRMSDMFASSAEKDSSAITTFATPYSSEGPTLPIIGAETEHMTGLNNDKSKNNRNTREKSKGPGHNVEKLITSKAQPVATFHPVLYEPWTLLPFGLTKILTSQARLRGTQNVVPIVFTKNHNVKSGINRLKTYFGAYMDKSQPLDMPEALKQIDVIIAVSAQGEGTAKLVSILDVARRVVAPSAKDKENGFKIDTWWMYTSLTSVEMEKRINGVSDAKLDAQPSQAKQDAEEDDDEEEEAFEPMKIDTPVQDRESEQKKMVKAPVLTVWMTKKKIPAFEEAFGEQTFEVLPLDDD